MVPFEGLMCSGKIQIHKMFPSVSDPPGPPTRVTPSDVAKDAVTLTWFEPDEDGGSPITGYWVEKFDPESDKWIRCNKLPIKDTTFR